MPPERVRLGKDAKIYYNSASPETPTWVEVNTVTNVELLSEWDETEVTARIHGDDKAFDMTLRERSAQFDLNSFEGDAAELALEGFHDGKTPKEFLILNGPRTVVGKRGIRGTFLVKNWPEAQPLDGHITRQGVQLRPAHAATMPVRYVVEEE